MSIHIPALHVFKDRANGHMLCFRMCPRLFTHIVGRTAVSSHVLAARAVSVKRLLFRASFWSIDARYVCHRVLPGRAGISLCLPRAHRVVASALFFIVYTLLPLHTLTLYSLVCTFLDFSVYVYHMVGVCV